MPRAMRDTLGPVPGTVRIREVDGGLLIEPLPTGRDEWWDHLHRELDSLSESQIASLADETARLDRAAGDGLRDR